MGILEVLEGFYVTLDIMVGSSIPGGYIVKFYDILVDINDGVAGIGEF